MLWFILFFAPAAFGATEWWSLAILESLIFTLAAMCALCRDFASPLIGPLVGFGAIIGLGSLQLLNPHPLGQPAGLLPFTLARPQTLYALLLWTALAALLWASAGILRWEGAIRRVSWSIFGAGLFIALDGILQRGQGNTAYYGMRPILMGKPFGPFTDYDHAATWMVASAFVAIGLFVAGIQRSRLPLTEVIAQRILLAFAIVILFTAIFMTGSRGGVNALFATALLTTYISAGSIRRAMARRISRAGVILAAIGYAAFLYSNPGWLGFCDGVLDISAASRISLYRSGLRMIGDFPFFGVGLGGFVNAFRPYQEPMVVGIVDHIHSSWLEIALESGIVGAGIFGGVIVKECVGLGRRLSAPDLPERALVAGCFAAFFAFALHGFVEFSFQIPADAVLFVVLLATVAILSLSSRQSPSRPIRRPGPLPAGAFLVLALLSLVPGFQGVDPRLGSPIAPGKFALLPSAAPDGSALRK